MKENDIAALQLNKDVIADAITMTNIERFLHLLQHAKSLVGLYGPYSKQPNTTVFSRDVRPPRHPKPQDPSLNTLALSFAAAQDCTYSAQPAGSGKEDLDLFTLLWDCAVAVLEEILARGSLPQESFGWGIFGLSAGYMHPPARDLTAQNVFLSNKRRLHDALNVLPSLNRETSSEYVVGEKKTTALLTRARRDIHTLGHILLHEYKLSSWRRVRWLHTIAVAERWVGAFGLKPKRELGVLIKRTKEVVCEATNPPGKKVVKNNVRFEFPNLSAQDAQGVLEERPERERCNERTTSHIERRRRIT
jgi:hypothetical protein